MIALSSIWDAVYGGLQAILFLDNLGVHRSPSAATHARRFGIEMEFLPPNTSHFMQPLDSAVFATFKTNLALYAHELNTALAMTGETLPDAKTSIITRVMFQAEEIALSRDVIVKSFAKTIFPWDPNAILERARLNIGAPTQVTRTAH